jgi:predicted amidohydrolase
VQIAKPFTAASVQFNPCLNNLDDNIQGLVEAVTEAAENGAKLIVTPEMATTGYHYGDRKTIKPFVDTIPGKTTAAFEEVAKHYNTHVVIGMAEVDEKDGLYYNSAALVGPNGYIGKYRKVHQWAGEESWSVWGDLGVPVFETSIGKVAMIICMDATYFESARLAAVNGADILCFPTNSTGGSLSMLQAWAEMNGLYVIGSNRSNTEEGYHMVGASVLWSPNGEKLAEAPYVTKEEAMDEASIVYAEIDPVQYDNVQKRRLQERRPELYHDLMLYIGPWETAKEDFVSDVTDMVFRYGTSIQAALLQYEPAVGEKELNWKKVSNLIEEAVQKRKQKDSDQLLIVCPELSLTGLVDSLDIGVIHQLAETVKEETVTKMKQLAVSYQIHLVFGMIEREDNILYNSVLLVTPQGEIAATARKMHLTNGDRRWAVPGDEIIVSHVEGLGRVGLMVGFDAAFPETAGVMAVKRADLILIPSSWHGDFSTELLLPPKMMENKYPENSMLTWDAIARLSQANTLAANFVGSDQGYKGSSALYTLDPIYGTHFPVTASRDQEQVLMITIPKLPADWWFNQQKLLLSRRTFYYKPLVTKNHNRNVLENIMER